MVSKKSDKNIKLSEVIITVKKGELYTIKNLEKEIKNLELQIKRVNLQLSPYLNLLSRFKTGYKRKAEELNQLTKQFRGQITEYKSIIQLLKKEFKADVGMKKNK